MTFPSENEALQLKFYLFQDDLKMALYDNPDAPAIDEAKAAAYIQKHFIMTVKGKPQTMKFVSMRFKDDQVKLEFACPKITLKGLNQIHILNTILIEQFKKQVNMVYLNAPGKDRVTLMLHAYQTEGTISL